MTKKANYELQQVLQKIQMGFAGRIIPHLAEGIYVINNPFQPFGLIGQFDEQTKQLITLDWVFLSNSSKKTITTRIDAVVTVIEKTRLRFQQLCGCDPAFISLPMSTDSFQVLFRESLSLQAALADYLNKIVFMNPSHKIFTLLEQIPLSVQSIIQTVPLPNARTVFIDGSGKSHKAAVTWQEEGVWRDSVIQQQGSTQLVKLAVAIHALELFSKEDVNIVAASYYVVGIIQRIPDSFLKDVSNKALFQLLLKLSQIISQRTHLIFIMHLRSHTKLPGPLVEGNARADTLTLPAILTQHF